MAGGERAPLAGLKVAEVESTKGDDTVHGVRPS